MRLELERQIDFVCDFSAVERRKYASAGVALKDGSFPIPNTDYLKRAIRAIGRGKNNAKATIKAHIIKRARALGATSLLPDSWNVGQEEAHYLDVHLALAQEGVPGVEVIAPPVLQEGQAAPDWVTRGAKRIRFPFIVGESISRTPGIEDEIYFPTRNVGQAVTAINQQIASGKQPITVYARHAHATSKEFLPIGGVVSAEDQGRLGWATAEIEPTSVGKDVQILLDGKKLNAMSLRSAPGLFELTPKEVNGVLRLEVDLHGVSGIDFAPDGPAMPTHGIEVLAAEAQVSDYRSKSRKKEVDSLDDDLTLESLRSDHGSLVAEIEAPLRKKITDAEAILADVKIERDTAVRTAAVAKLAMAFPKSSDAFAVLQEFCKDAKSEAEVAMLAQPVLLKAIEKGLIQGAGEEPKPDKPAVDLVLERLFPQASREEGSGDGEKPKDDKSKEGEKPRMLTQEKVGQGMPALPF